MDIPIYWSVGGRGGYEVMHVRETVSHGWARLWFDLVPIWFPNQKSITAVGTNQPGKDRHYKLIERRAEETIRLIDSIDTGGEDEDAMNYII